jgi:hypothetical protein
VGVHSQGADAADGSDVAQVPAEASFVDLEVVLKRQEAGGDDAFGLEVLQPRHGAFLFSSTGQSQSRNRRPNARMALQFELPCA